MERVNKDKLNTLFKALRKRGFIAKQDYKWSTYDGYMGCLEDMKKKIAAGKKIIGLCFYSKEAGETADNHGGALELSFAGNTSADELAVGEIIMAESKEAGLPVEWNGKSGSMIRVLPEKVY